MQSTIKNRTIFCKDNLHILQGIDSHSIDLIYLDPPFNKKKIFTAPVGSSSEGASFSDVFRAEDIKDEWLQTIKEDNRDLYLFLNTIHHQSGKNNKYNFCYLSYMSIRLLELHRVLKDTGSIYLHCDSTMSHHLKIVLDCIFDEDNFRNEIVWQRNDNRAKGSQYESKKYGSNTDSILFYTKSNNFKILPYKEMSEEEKLKKFDKKDKERNPYYTGIPLFRSKSMGDRPNLCYEWKGFKNSYPSGWRLKKDRLEEEYKKGNIVIGEDGKLERRKYLKDYKGNILDNNWVDIPRLSSSSESTGYPTQKPLALLERIIKASSNEGDIVLDPFCGCATTCVASENLGRQWIGIDVSVEAYELVKQRLKTDVKRDTGTKGTGQDLLQKDIKIHFSPEVPKRTDMGEDASLKKWIYVISNEHYPDEYKVGIANNWKSRLNSYQTSDPNRAYKIEFKQETPYFRETEKHIHDHFENRHEWVRAKLEDIIQEIKSYKPL